MSAEAEAAARAALDGYFEAWNSADLEAVRSHLNFPFVTLGPAGQLFVNETREDFQTDFERMRRVEGWHRSTLDSCTATASSPNKVHFEITFSRYKSDDSVYGTGRVMYIFTNHDGHWGMQLRSGMPDDSLAAAVRG